MHIFSYVITHDSGFAPNPFGGFLTLATCKPRIRRNPCKGDFIVGTGSAKTVGNHKLVFAGQIGDVIRLEEYGMLPNYWIKRPTTVAEWWRKHGDNIYFKKDGRWLQRQSVHHASGDMAHDLHGMNVLICKRFWYFGNEAIEIPANLRGIIKRGPGHKRITEEALVKRFVAWLESQPKGRHGMPEMSPEKTVRCVRRAFEPDR